MPDFYSGFNDARARNEKSTLADLQAVQGVQALSGHMQDQEAKAEALRRERAGRAAVEALGPGATDEQVMGALRPHVGLDKLAALTEHSQTSRLTRENTKAIALSRIQQANDKLDNDYAIAMQKLAGTAQGKEFDQWYKRAKIALETEAKAQGADRSFYETGFRRPPVSIEAPPVAPGASGTAPLSSLGQVERGTASNEASAVGAINAGGGKPMSFEVTGQPQVAAPSPVPSAPAPNPSAWATPTAPAAAPAPQPTAIPPLTRAQGGLAPDAEPDLRARAQAAFEAAKAPVAGGAADAAPTPKALTLADAPAGLSPKDQAKWLLQQTKPSISGAGKLTPQSLEFVAKQYLSGDRQAIQGFARSTTERVALQNAIVDEAAKQGMSPTATAAKIAEFAGTVAGSRTVGQRAANISLAATEAEEMIPIVKEQSDKFARTNFVPWNMALKAYDSGTGSPEIAAFGASVNALVNVYARAINPTGVPTVSDKEHARAVLNTVQSPAQVDAVLGIIRRELDVAKRAPSTVRAATTERITGAPAGGGTPKADQFFR